MKATAMKCAGWCLVFVIFLIGFPSGGLAASEEAVDPRKIQLGKNIFFDESLSRPVGQSCSSCHDPAYGFADPNQLAVSQGAIQSRVGNRNAQSVAYAMFSPPLYFDPETTPAIPEGQYKGGLFWDGRANTLEEQAKQPFVNPLEMHNPSKKTVVLSVRQSEYARVFKEVFGPSVFDDVDFAYDCVGQALAAYMRSPEVSPFTSKYDYWKKGEVQFTDSELRGYELFQPMGKARCANCHAEGKEGLFTNFGHQNLGTPRNPELPYYFLPRPLNPAGTDYIDRGVGDFLRSIGVPEEDAAKEDGKFKIPSLRNCAVTPPYTHNGYHLTLRKSLSLTIRATSPAPASPRRRYPRPSTGIPWPCREPWAGWD